MRKYLFTESQIKKVVDAVANEQINRKERHQEILKLRDLAEIISRTGVDFESLLMAFQDAFRDGGDEEVMELFKIGTGIEVENIGKGRYILKY